MTDLYMMPGDGPNCPMHRTLSSGDRFFFYGRDTDEASEAGMDVSTGRIDILRRLTGQPAQNLITGRKSRCPAVRGHLFRGHPAGSLRTTYFGRDKLGVPLPSAYRENNFPSSREGLDRLGVATLGLVSHHSFARECLARTWDYTDALGARCPPAYKNPRARGQVATPLRTFIVMKPEADRPPAKSAFRLLHLHFFAACLASAC